MAKRKEEAAVDVTLPITPMLDMSFQLLSFFIITFRAPSQEGQLSVDLPRLDVNQAIDQIPPETAQKDDYTIILNGDTEIRAIAIKGAAITEKDLKDAKSLSDTLTDIAKSKGGVGKAGEFVSITIESDDRLVYSKLIEVMDICKKAGFDSVNLKPFSRKGN